MTPTAEYLFVLKITTKLEHWYKLTKIIIIAAEVRLGCRAKNAINDKC